MQIDRVLWSSLSIVILLLSSACQDGASNEAETSSDATLVPNLVKSDATDSAAEQPTTSTTSALETEATCATQSEQETPVYFCSSANPAANNYKLSIYIYKTCMTILQSSNNARFKPLHYSISEADYNDYLTPSSEKLQFSCTIKKAEANNYQAIISVFGSYMPISRSSSNAKFAPLVYKIQALEGKP